MNHRVWPAPPCPCRRRHPRRRIVLTGGPGAGKTAVLELIRRHFCRHVQVLPESASILFGGGFPRSQTPNGRRSAQRAIFYVQRELEEFAAEELSAVEICDRGTVDGVAYWPGSAASFWRSVGTTPQEALSRYYAVIHLRTPRAGHGYSRENLLRIESAAEAARIDERIARAWEGHPRRLIVESRSNFLEKVQEAVGMLRAFVPPCCTGRLPPIGSGRSALPVAGRASRVTPV